MAGEGKWNETIGTLTSAPCYGLTETKRAGDPEHTWRAVTRGRPLIEVCDRCGGMRRMNGRRSTKEL